MKVAPGKPDPNTPGAFISVRIYSDATEEAEVDGEVRPARNEGMPRAVYMEGWMM